MGLILDWPARLAEGADLVLGGFNVATSVRGPGDGVAMSSGERALLEQAPPLDSASTRS